jgi:aminoglycoside phosphotransferase
MGKHQCCPFSWILCINWEKLKEDMDKTSVKIKQMDENGTTMQELNDTLKRELFEKYGQKHTI